MAAVFVSLCLMMQLPHACVLITTISKTANVNALPRSTPQLSTRIKSMAAAIPAPSAACVMKLAAETARLILFAFRTTPAENGSVPAFRKRLFGTANAPTATSFHFTAMEDVYPVQVVSTVTFAVASLAIAELI